jgi:hypothetical protein
MIKEKKIILFYIRELVLFLFKSQIKIFQMRSNKSNNESNQNINQTNSNNVNRIKKNRILTNNDYCSFCDEGGDLLR